MFQAGKTHDSGDYDSDGFIQQQDDYDDYSEMTLEEKILCGYYSARPNYRDSYPIAQMNMPKPRGQMSNTMK